MPRGWRIVKSAHARTAFDGEGARLYGGRWNSPGTAVVYTAQGESLAALELVVHMQATHILMSYCSIPADFDNSVVRVVDPAALPADWRDFPAPRALQQIGDQWAVEQRSVVLQVPSAIVPAELNYILNPRHPDFTQITIGSPSQFPFDPRFK